MMASTSALWKLSLVVTILLNINWAQSLLISVSKYDCEIPLLSLQDSKYGVVLEQNQRKLKEPEGGYYRWKTGDRIYIGCKDELRTVVCSNKVSNKDFLCKSSVLVTYKPESTSCAQIGTKYQVGFSFDKTKFIAFYEVCYNMEDCSVIYTSHQLLGTAFHQTSRVPRVDKSFTNFACQKLDYRTLYTQRSQQNNPKIVNSKNWYLQRGHLFPDRDAPVYAWKLATYLYGNCAPEWETINSRAGNWHELEGMVSNMSISKSHKYDIFDGVLYDQNQQNKVFLDQTAFKIEVPTWYWKAVIHNDEEIIFFVYNNPFSSPASKFCPQDRCLEYFWKFDSDVANGMTHCCLHKDLKQNTLPGEVMKALGTRSKGLRYYKRPRSG